MCTSVAQTSSTVMASMQVGVSGQTFLRQGLQGKSFLITRLIPPQGPVR